MSGCGARAVMYFGILDVFKENNIPVDYISACSSSTLIACAYSCGKSEEFKHRILNLETKELFFEMFKPSFKGGLFSINGIDDHLRQFVHVENLEDLPIPVAVVAADLINGDEVIFTMGDLYRAVRASCTMPGLFEPVVWGEKVLMDGGLFSIIPVEAAKLSGADVIIGMDLSSNDKIFPDNLLAIRRGYKFFTKPLRRLAFWLYQLEQRIWPRDEDIKIDSVKIPNVFNILGKALDYAMVERRTNEYFNCDVIIRPDVKGFGEIGGQKNMGEKMYEEGRRAALVALPKIKELLAE